MSTRPPASAAPLVPGRPVRLASYNIRKAVGLDWKRDAGRTLDVINEIGADAVVLQEADKRLGARPAALPREMIARETDFTVADLAPNAVSLGWHGNAVLVRRGLAVTAAERLALPGLEPRGAVLVRLGEGPGAITVVGVHLALMRRWRLRQLHTIRARFCETESARTVILGDFNEWSETRGFEPLADRFRVVAPGKTFHASRPRAGLDRIAHGHGLALGAAGVHETPRARAASDHLPIWADMAPAA
ncbi:endonuclease/exonuclease/phosphatase family protein [Rhodovulum marinum]|uniref:Endonuclease/exonuclease/phosphatase family metal-dependent hydrolase n=1 Tax=Rhodovulum marinum TaxID=320662 RepID=A0A4V2SRT2_9RHOB|nr:endonuclease/exonuclease/phosphatase family protein [Rhodovulum marinum]TCP44236.1 endonuclease/exonuclease/phosphatase family metal-dependent hydrolase [Rhodovulum marinum]